MYEIIFILLLLVCNSVFAMTEIALVSVRKGRLKQLAAEGNSGAAQALKLLEVGTQVLMRLFGCTGMTPSWLSREEVQVIVREGIITGTVDENESDMVEGVFDLRVVTADEIMKPKPMVVSLKSDESPAQFWPRAAASLLERGAASFRKSGNDTWIVDGLMEIDDVIEQLPGLEEVVEKEQEPFQTLAGYIVHRLDRLPAEGESFCNGCFSFQVIDMDRQRIDKVMIRKLSKGDEGDFSKLS